MNQSYLINSWYSVVKKNKPDFTLYHQRNYITTDKGTKHTTPKSPRQLYIESVLS